MLDPLHSIFIISFGDLFEDFVCPNGVTHCHEHMTDKLSTRLRTAYTYPLLLHLNPRIKRSKWEKLSMSSLLSL